MGDSTDSEAHKAPATPEWMTPAFFSSILQRDFPGIEVIKVHAEPAVPVGENYACIVHRVLLERADRNDDMSLIVKSLPTAGYRATMVRDAEITLREVRMYKETMAFLGDPCNHPRCFYAEMDDVKDAVVLEDLRPFGYKTRDRKLGLDLPHAKLVMEQIGRFHGAGVALRINEPEEFEREIRKRFPDVLWAEINREKLTPWTTLTMGALSEAIVRDLPFRFHKLAEITKELGDCIVDVLQEALQIPDDPEEQEKIVYTLNHGDTWSNNILFKYEQGEKDPQHCVLIDYQLTRAAPAVIDLVYFFYSSTSQELRKNHLDELLQHYIDSAKQIMNERGITCAGKYFFNSAADVKEDFKKYSLTAYILGCFIMPIVIGNADDAPDLDTLTEENLVQMEESPFSQMYSGPLFCKRFKELLEDCDDLGAFKPGAWKKYKNAPATSNPEE